MHKGRKLLGLVILVLFTSFPIHAQHSVARQWNEALLHAIRHDFARPTVHARNLFHTSIGMYEAWASYTAAADHYFLGDSLGSYFCPFNDTALSIPPNIKAAQEEALSYAAYRILKARFANSPGATSSQAYFDSLFTALGYNPAITGVNYAQGGAAELGNYIAQEILAFGLTDNSNEQNGYANQFYSPVNQTLLPVVPGNPNITDPNRWQPLTLQTFIDQSGNVIPIATPAFLSPEWGKVVPFALSDSVKTLHTRNGNTYPTFYNLPAPPYMDTVNPINSEAYKWGFRMVSKWSSHLDTTDGVVWDISPGNTGNVNWLPSTIDSLPHFYDEDDGHDFGNGYSTNPATGQPYPPQMVKRGDYARVLAEFWADGPDSETPPGHWFTIVNYVNDQPQLQRKWKGTGPVLDPLEWDIKCYFTLAGAMHDAAVAAWGAKGWYDYLRPISAIRYMADLGQSSDSTLPSYHPNGIELDSGYVELVDSTDALADSNYVNVGKIKVYVWRGPDSISDPATDMAGVGWILAENWWPYQRPSFVTPPFAGYVSGHSTFSRAAAEVLTHITDDPYFPGGMGEFLAEKNKFLVFEEGPSTDVKLQWATYRDASDQCSLSRIWGGIHPPADDIPGRIMGEKIGVGAFHFARKHWENGIPDLVNLIVSDTMLTDNSAPQWTAQLNYDLPMDTTIMPQVSFPVEDPSATLSLNQAASAWISPYEYRAVFSIVDSNQTLTDIDIRVSGSVDVNNVSPPVYNALDHFSIDMENPALTIVPSQTLLNDSSTVAGNFTLQLQFSEKVDTLLQPQLSFPADDPTAQSLQMDSLNSRWLDSLTYQYAYTLLDANEEFFNIQIQLAGAFDLNGNQNDTSRLFQVFDLDTKNPNLIATTSIDTIKLGAAGTAGFTIAVDFSENMDTSYYPKIAFPVEDPTATLTINSAATEWQSLKNYQFVFDVDTAFNRLSDIDFEVDSAYDLAGNLQLANTYANAFHIDISSAQISLSDFSNQALAVFPNPLKAGQNLTLENIPPSAERLRLFNAQGALVREIGLVANRKQEISTTGLKPGFYHLVFAGVNKAFTIIILES